MHTFLRRTSSSLLIAVVALDVILFITALAYVRYHVQVDSDVDVKSEHTRLATHWHPDNNVVLCAVSVGSEYPLALPIILVTMEDTENYAIYGSQANAEWIATTPKANGYIHVGKENRFMSLAFGHEMHCIRILRMAIAYPLHPNANIQHANHCLNYLRMYALCNPDLTLEKFDLLEGNVTFDKLGATHICRDWRLVYDELSRALREWAAFNGRNYTD